jgi:hypothetical protein
LIVWQPRKEPTQGRLVHQAPLARAFAPACPQGISLEFCFPKHDPSLGSNVSVSPYLALFFAALVGLHSHNIE